MYGICTVNTDCSQEEILCKKKSVSHHATSFIMSVFRTILFIMCIFLYTENACYPYSHQQRFSW